MNSELRAGLFVIVTVGILLLIAVFPQHVYDLPTAMFFTLSLVCFQRRQLLPYVLLFPFSCLNRETTILLTLLFAVYFFRRMDRRTYLLHLVFQLVVYGVIFLAVRWIFANAPGQDAYFNPRFNLQIYAARPLLTAIFLGLAALVVGLVRIKWRRAPELCRTAFLVFAPILVVMYVLIGRTFEVRVFIELVPVVGIIGVS